MPESSLTADQNLALRSAAGRLATEFEGVFGTETIETVRGLGYRIDTE